MPWVRWLLVLVLAATPAEPARADLPTPPRPTRPDWDDPPAPLPEPPDEAWLRLLLLALVAGSAMALARGRRREARGAG